MGGMSRGRDDIWGLILLSEAWWTAPCGGGEPPTKVGGLREDILFKSKEYPLALPKKDSRGDFVCPPGTPLKRPTERPAGLSFGRFKEGLGGKFEITPRIFLGKRDGIFF